MNKKISRKTFLRTTTAGIAGMGLAGLAGTRPTKEELRTIPLGSTGIAVTPLCFGASRTNQESLVEQALRSGINFIDTGRSYARGRNEEMVGRVLNGSREKVIIQSKIYLRPEEVGDRYHGPQARKKIRHALQYKLDESLEALNTDYIDVLLMHNAEDPDLVFHESSIEWFEEQKKKGIIKAHGFSVHRQQLDFVRRNNSTRAYDVILVAFNYKGSFVHSLSNWEWKWDQTALVQALQEAAEKGTGIVGMKTCSGGPMEGTGGATYGNAVQWVTTRPYVHSAAVAIANYDHLEEHIRSVAAGQASFFSAPTE